MAHAAVAPVEQRQSPLSPLRRASGLQPSSVQAMFA
jgi:hypothetical protein